MNKGKTSFTISEDNAALLEHYSQEYGASKGKVINLALALYFELSGYSKEGYSVEAQRDRASNFNVLAEEERETLLSPPPSAIERDLYHSQVTGGLEEYPEEISEMVINGDTAKARKSLLSMEEKDGL